ncbi:MAG: dihydroorotate dehydrogenase [bacterium]|jgi:dihydroorotate dehydrogenase (NAD+) catalytic subunit
MSEPKLAVNLAGIKMKNPVMTASGTCGYGREYRDFYDVNELGAIVVKGLTREPRPGNPVPRIAETPAGILNAIGLQNPGLDVFLREEIPYLRELSLPVIVNIAGNEAEDYRALAAALDGTGGIAALEVNISCPNVKKGGMAFGTDPDAAHAVVRAIRQETGLPVIVKLSPNVTDITAIARGVEAAGADAVSLINTLVGMAVDIRTRRPVIANIVGGLSGPAVKPVALRMVWEVARAVRLPIIGIGGISTAEDAIEFLLAGATAVAVGTASFVNPRAPVEIIAGISQYLAANGIADVNELIGGLRC